MNTMDSAARSCLTLQFEMARLVGPTLAPFARAAALAVETAAAAKILCPTPLGHGDDVVLPLLLHRDQPAAALSQPGA